MIKGILSIILCLFIPLHVVAEEDAIEKVDWNLSKTEIVVTFLDLSSGEAILIQTGHGETILINTGGPQTTDELINRLETLSVLKLDSVLLTSLDKQYVSNLMWLNRGYIIDEIIVPDVFRNELQTEFTLQHGNIQYWDESIMKEMSSGVTIRPLNIQYEGGMSLHVGFGKHDLLLMGAADSKVEEAILKKSSIRAEILKVAQFAQADGTSESFLKKVDPHVAIIFRERKRMPSSDVLERLNETWIDIYQTRQFGNVAIRFDQENYEVITFEAKDKE
ncbi:ComEC/Rec2 family competence protein [Bacillus solimangrovi]|uniref:Hydrolase n=1 Tax=Bacillus solimangrovi TaxID=1305675 RepID=A0A1E5LH60_9BACI|nr:hypothetical protein [Bacillus solimangrovi]OEH93420.1 hypothetical protein BFG57_00040 [Bacillus solimangrovi]